MVLLRQEFPRAYFLICANLSGRSISVEVDGQFVFLDCRPLEVLLPNSIERADVRVVSSRRTILDVIDARLTIDQAVRNGSIYAGGRQSYIDNCHNALLFFVRGAVRSPSFPALLQEFRRFSANQVGGYTR